MPEEEKKHYLLKILGIILATFIGAFLAFYFAVDITLNRMMSPEYHIKKMEKLFKNHEKSFYKFDEKMLDNPFEPKMAPMLVNLVKEPAEYKIIVDLKPLDGNEKNVNVTLNGKILTVSGEIDKTNKKSEKIMNFTQSFYLDEDLIPAKMTKEKSGNKYIITLPFEE